MYQLGHKAAVAYKVDAGKVSVRGRPKVFPASSGIAKQLTNSFKLPDACGDAGGPDTDDDNVIWTEIQFTCLYNESILGN